MIRAECLFLPISHIRPTEEILPERVDEVVLMVLERRAWTQPICVEKTVHALLDGHHRLAAAQRLGLFRVPVHVFDYADVELLSWRPDHAPTRAEVLARARSGELYPHKTTRHVFPEQPCRAIPLALLIDGGADATSVRQGAACGGLTALRSGVRIPPPATARRA